jgi:hypothetical protein
VSLEEEVDEQALDRRGVVADLMVAARRQRCMLEPVQGALAGERRAILAPGGELAGQGRQHRIVAQLIVVDQILIPERDAEHALRHHRRDAVLDLGLGATVDETRRKAPDQADRPIGRTQQQRPRVRGDLAAVKGGHHPAALDRFITEQIAATLCRHRGAPPHRPNCLSQKSYRRFRAPMHLSSVRNPG